MRDAQPAILISGLLLIGLAVFMTPSLLIDLADGSSTWRGFAGAAMITAFSGGAMSLSAQGRLPALSTRAGFAVTVASWVTLSTFAAIPFLLQGSGMRLVDAIFEAMSGLTTTGATVMTGLDGLPRGILLWRAMLHWIGGIGLVVTGIAILPMLRTGGMQLFRLESSDNSEKILPRAQQIVGQIILIYSVLTLCCMAGFLLCGMTWFQAIAHAMSTVSTGGFSTSDASMGAFTAGGSDLVAIIFMTTAALPFGAFMLMARTGPGALFADPQVRGFLLLVLATSAVVCVYLVTSGRYETPEALRLGVFNVVSVASGTGFATTDYSLWGAPAVTLFFLLTFVGGGAGSTAGGIKIFRFQVAFASFQSYLREVIRPHSVAPIGYNGRCVPEQTAHSVLTFFALFFTVFGLMSIALTATGLDAESALSGAAAALANVGPGLGATVGPATTFAEISDTGKWVLTVGMLLGRLELLTVLVLFSPAFWRT